MRSQRRLSCEVLRVEVKLLICVRTGPKELLRTFSRGHGLFVRQKHDRLIEFARRPPTGDKNEFQCAQPNLKSCSRRITDGRDRALCAMGCCFEGLRQASRDRCRFVPEELTKGGCGISSPIPLCREQIPGKRAGAQDQKCQFALRDENANGAWSCRARLHSAKCGHIGDLRGADFKPRRLGGTTRVFSNRVAAPFRVRNLRRLKPAATVLKCALGNMSHLQVGHSCPTKGKNARP